MRARARPRLLHAAEHGHNRGGEGAAGGRERRAAGAGSERHKGRAGRVCELLRGTLKARCQARASANEQLKQLPRGAVR